MSSQNEKKIIIKNENTQNKTKNNEKLSLYQRFPERSLKHIP